MAPLEPWKRVFVSEDFLTTTHGEIGCIECHGGTAFGYHKDDAHDGLVPYPSEEPATYCLPCHSADVATHTTSLHRTQEGYYERFTLRAGYDLRNGAHPEALAEFEGECGACHASCGQCHVSRPRTVLGGMDFSHEFRTTPDMNTQCTACHGSRIGEEYKGERDGYPADVHYIPGLKKCEYCHTGYSMHGADGTQLTYRYDDNNTSAPRCETCHSADAGKNSYHTAHWNGSSGVNLSCQVCHSQAYKNCNGCHAGGSGITGSSYLTFEIGRNYRKNTTRYGDYDYITVRHIPITPDTFAEFGIDDLPNFETSEPTWKMTTPHNIQLLTDRTRDPANPSQALPAGSCATRCHDSDYYLRAADIDTYATANYNADTGESGYGYDDIERERQANAGVIIPQP